MDISQEAVPYSCQCWALPVFDCCSGDSLVNFLRITYYKHFYISALLLMSLSSWKAFYVISNTRASHRLRNLVHLELFVADKARSGIGSAGINCHNIQAVLQDEGSAQVPPTTAQIHQPLHTKPLINMHIMHSSYLKEQYKKHYPPNWFISIRFMDMKHSS